MRKSLFLIGKSKMLVWKSRFLIRKSEMLARKSLFLMRKSKILTRKWQFPKRKSEMLARKSLFLISKSKIRARRQCPADCAVFVATVAVLFASVADKWETQAVLVVVEVPGASITIKHTESGLTRTAPSTSKRSSPRADR